MRIMVVGGGGREHAIIKKLRENSDVEVIYALPGNAGIAEQAVCMPIAATDIDGIVRFAKSMSIDFAVIAPDDPLALGAVDALHAIGVECFGPDRAAARIESSKAFAKNLMKKYGIPTASFETFDDADAAIAYVRSANRALVVKADGLALGKGVLICPTAKEAEDAVNVMMREHRFGASGARVVIEEFLEGPEVSVLSFTDGHCVVPMVSSMDHKRACDHDTGLNTGGMGAIAPNPFYTKEIAERCMREIFLPTIQAMRAEGCPFKGCLYFGLMLTKDGPKVIEYNCRFGDPETQAVLPLLESDLLTIMRAVEREKLSITPVRFENGASCCVMIASGGYPEKYKKGMRIDLGHAAELAEIYHSGTARNEKGEFVTNGGRVLGACCVRDTLECAVSAAYRAVDEIHFDNMHYRHDIGARALAAMRD